MELVKTAVYFKNRSPTKPLLDTTFWESLHGEKSDLSNLRIIKSLVYYYNIETETGPNRRIKSDSKVRQIKLIEYSKESVNTKYETLLMIKSEKLYLFALTNQII
jgi:hypothetical protein